MAEEEAWQWQGEPRGFWDSERSRLRLRERKGGAGAERDPASRRRTALPECVALAVGESCQAFWVLASGESPCAARTLLENVARRCRAILKTGQWLDIGVPGPW